jgi:hypothetical protein
MKIRDIVQCYDLELIAVTSDVGVAKKNVASYCAK